MEVRKFFFIFLSSFILLLSLCYAAKPSLESKVALLNQASSQNLGVVELDSNLYDEFVAKPRNYSMAILLTALDPQINCIPCKEFDPEFRLVARSWLEAGNEPSRLYFGVLDFKNGREVYAKLGLNNAPTLFYFSPTTGPYAKDVSEPNKYEFNRHGFSAEEFASYLSGILGTQVPVKRPLNYFSIFITTILILGALASIKLMYPMMESIIRSKNTWATISLVVILMMISGHMWNHIRGPPYVYYQNSQVSYIAHGFSNQFGIESQIVAVVYGICSFSVIALIHLVPKVEDKNKQRFGTYLWMGILFTTFSLLFALFRIKNPGYPFKLFI
ncbi:magnesium transporter protein-like protein 1 precursor [Gigaspora margarita]|uniref:Magnesium transporter protein-like protein 1 n=1 Tax=Gigaspora margarita TaxID=4874 RepID=A0A8H3ZYV6_GIGMA|nr:magnesium transporter protein-like protein 1 precursor [Gigaspora margarita]